MAELMLALGCESWWDDLAGRERWTCPRCQPPGSSHRIMYLASAELLDGGVGWRCSLCHSVETLWGLRRRVLEDLDVLDRLVDVIRVDDV